MSVGYGVRALKQRFSSFGREDDSTNICGKSVWALRRPAVQVETFPAAAGERRVSVELRSFRECAWSSAFEHILLHASPSNPETLLAGLVAAPAGRLPDGHDDAAALCTAVALERV